MPGSIFDTADVPWNINTDMLNVLSALDVEVSPDLCYSFLVDLLG